MTVGDTVVVIDTVVADVVLVERVIVLPVLVDSVDFVLDDAVTVDPVLVFVLVAVVGLGVVQPVRRFHAAAIDRPFGLLV